jgi:Class II flagellar assembly regulator
MKVQGPSSSTPAAGTRRAGGSVAPGFVLPGEELGGVAPVARPSPNVGISSMGALLALQMEDDITERRRRATARSNTLIDQLDAIRLAMLGPGVSREQLARLARTLREQRDAVDDPELSAILDDIELRAEVELAKLERAL